MKNRILVLILISGLLLFHALNNYYILTKSRYTPVYDTMRNFKGLNEIYQSLALGKAKLNLNLPYKIYTGVVDSKIHPQLFLYTAVPFFLFRIDKNIVVMVNFIYFAILLFATYGFGKRLYNQRVGILALFIVSMFPAVFGFSRVFMLDFPLMAMVALTFYLFTVNRFDKLIFSLLTGSTIGLGLLTKESYLIFLIPILTYFILQQKNRRDIKSIIGFCSSIFLGVLISGKYYINSEKIILFRGWIFQRENIEPYYYLNSLSHQLMPIFFLLFFASLIFCYRKKQYFLPNMTIALLLLFSLSPCKSGRFILPLFPYIAVMIAGFVWSSPKIRKISTLILILISFLQYFFISYSSYIRYHSPQTISHKTSGLDLDCQGLGLATIIDEGDWQSPAEEIIKIISENKEKIGIGSEVSLGLFSHERIYYALDYWSIVKRLPLEIHTPFEGIDPRKPYMVKITKQQKDVFDDPVANFDFVIVQENFPENEKMLDYISNNLDHFKRNFIGKFCFIKTIILPDGCSCTIYKKIKYEDSPKIKISYN